MSDTCSSCSAAVIWAITAKNNKRMPVDAAPTPDGSIMLVASKTRPGVTIAVVVPESERAAHTELRKSHFATCPNSMQHRKKKEK